MSFEEGMEDEPEVFRAPPPVDDRLWRHPSEVGPALARLRNARRHERPVWAVSLLSGMVGALLAAGLVTVADDGQRHGGQPVIERVQVSAPVSNVAGVATPNTLNVVDIADRVRPAITQVKVSGPKGQGSGSGVIFATDGHVLTNAHVVSGADSITVVLPGGAELAASVVGSDPESDIAVLKIPGGPYPTATFGTAADLRVGQPAVAIGDPLGLVGGPSVTVGVVSALHRQVEPSGDNTPLFDMIQTDAPISPGSSGGALLDGHGSVIGVTTAVAVSDAGGERVGFATPVDAARSVAEQLIATGRVVHVWLGIQGADVDRATASDLKIDGGALIATVVKGGPADRAGLEARDVIVGVGDRPTTSMGALVVQLRRWRPGETVTLDLIRNHRRSKVKVLLAERPH
ncbi:MAG: S1C family serine protease [Acidimicrobiales bacterium]